MELMGDSQANFQDGHTLLLVEADQNERTFSDYPNLSKCLQTIVNMYEEYRSKCCQRSVGDLKEFHAWVDSLHRVEIYVLDKEISRYRLLSREKMKQHFEERGDEYANHNQSNGHTIPSPAMSEEMNDCNSEEDWDED